MTSAKTFVAAALIALSCGTAMAAATGGGGAGGGGAGDAGGFAGNDAPRAAVQIPGIPQAAPQAHPGQMTICRYELLRGRYCETYTTR